MPLHSSKIGVLTFQVGTPKALIIPLLHLLFYERTCPFTPLKNSAKSENERIQSIVLEKVSQYLILM